MDIAKHRLHNQRLVGAKSVATVAPLTGRQTVLKPHSMNADDQSPCTWDQVIFLPGRRYAIVQSRSRCMPMTWSNDMTPPPTLEERVVAVVELGIHLSRDTLSSIAYSEELISSTISVTLQSTDRHHGIVGQERCYFQLDS